MFRKLIAAFLLPRVIKFVGQRLSGRRAPPARRY